MFSLHRSPPWLPLPVHHRPLWLTFPPLSHPTAHGGNSRTHPTPSVALSSPICTSDLSTPPLEAPGCRHQASETRTVEDGIFPQTGTGCGTTSPGHDTRTSGSPSPDLQPCPSHSGERGGPRSLEAQGPASATPAPAPRPQSSTAAKGKTGGSQGGREGTRPDQNGSVILLMSGCVSSAPHTH